MKSDEHSSGQASGPQSSPSSKLSSALQHSAATDFLNDYGARLLEEIAPDTSFMIVDDAPGSTESLYLHLCSLGARKDKISLCSGVLLAKKRIDLSPVDIILCNLQLKNGSGINVLQYAREHSESYPSIFILLTASPSADDVAEAKALGVSSVIVKPIDLATLTDHILFSLMTLDKKHSNQSLTPSTKKAESLIERFREISRRLAERQLKIGDIPERK